MAEVLSQLSNETTVSAHEHFDASLLLRSIPQKGVLDALERPVCDEADGDQGKGGSRDLGGGWVWVADSAVCGESMALAYREGFGDKRWDDAKCFSALSQLPTRCCADASTAGTSTTSTVNGKAKVITRSKRACEDLGWESKSSEDVCAESRVGERGEGGKWANGNRAAVQEGDGECTFRTDWLTAQQVPKHTKKKRTHCGG